MIVYVILTSVQNIIYKVDSWTKNPFIAKRYFKQFERYYPGAMLREYECNSHLDLIKQVILDSSVTITEFPGLELVTKTSYDSKLTMIYRDVYRSIIDDDNIRFTIIKYYNELLVKHIKLCKYTNININISNIRNAQIDLVYAWRILMTVRGIPKYPIIIFIEE